MVRLQLQVCLRGDVALMYNEEGKRMYFVHRGTMQVMHENFTLSYLKEGSYFGEIGLITSKQTATVRAVVDSLLYFLAKPDFEEVPTGARILLTSQPALHSPHASCAAHSGKGACE